MAGDEQTNFRPLYKTAALPCEGQVGDMIVISRLDEGEFDPSDTGLGQVWFCTRASNPDQRALWCRVAFEGKASCEIPYLKEPPPIPTLEGG